MRKFVPMFVVAVFGSALAFGLPAHVARDHGPAAAPWFSVSPQSAVDGPLHCLHDCHDTPVSASPGSEHEGHWHCVSDHFAGKAGEAGPELPLNWPLVATAHPEWRDAGTERVSTEIPEPGGSPFILSSSPRGPPAC